MEPVGTRTDQHLTLIAFFGGALALLLISVGLHLVDADDWPWYVEKSVGALAFITFALLIRLFVRRSRA